MAVRGGYGIYYEREDNGTVDNFGFSSPFLAGSFGPAPPGSLANLPAFSILPPAGVISPDFVPQLGVFQGFIDNVTGLPTLDTTQTPIFSGNSEFLIALEAPLHFISPSAQQWNLTVERELTYGWIFNIGYVGTKGTHLREVSTPIQPFLVDDQHPVTLTVRAARRTRSRRTLCPIRRRGRACSVSARRACSVSATTRRPFTILSKLP